MHASYVKPFSPKSDQKQNEFQQSIKMQPIDANAYTIQGKQGLLW